MICRSLRVATFLAPNLFPLYAFISRYLGARLGCLTELFVGTSYDQLADEVDLAFVCGLPYVDLVRRRGPVVEPLAAPVLRGERYGGRPVYYSDVVVHQDSPFGTFSELRGRSWAYNEPLSQSGYGVIRYGLVRMGETRGFFGRVVEAGWHERSLRLVCNGEVDATAVDSHVLTVALRDRPDLARRLRVIHTFGPSTIQPVVASRALPEELREDVRIALVEMADDPVARERLARGEVERFVPVFDESYDDIRTMLRASEEAGFLRLR